MTFFDDVSAVAFTEAAEHCGMARCSTFLGQITAVVTQLIEYDIFLCAEKGIKGLT